jgi:hypothetical protein
MHRHLISILILLFVSAFSFASDFAIKITDKTKSVKEIGIGEAYFQEALETLQLISDNSLSLKNVFNFSGKIVYPTAVRIYGTAQGIDFNELLFVQAGKQEFELSINNGKVKIEQKGTTQISNDYALAKEKFFPLTVEDKIPAITLRKIIKENPDSQVSLYLLINQIFNFGFDLGYLEVDTLFLGNVRSGKNFAYLQKTYFSKNSVSAVKLVRISNSFIENVLPQNGKPTLIEFWMQNCSGCLTKFKEFSKDKDSIDVFFNIVAVNIEAASAGAKWNELAREIPFPTRSYWDKSAEEFMKITTAIDKLPANIIVASDGKILARDADISNLSKIWDWGKFASR